MKIIVAHLAYCMDQNEPSKPEIARLKSDRLEEELKKLFIDVFECFYDEETDEERRFVPEDLALFKGDSWGDVVVTDAKEESNQFVFVTFEKKELMKGLKLKKSCFNT